MQASISPMSVKLEPALRERLNVIAERHKRSAHAIAREAIAAYVEVEDARDALNRDAMAAWHHYQETGLHVTASEVESWVQSWGSETETPSPKCHG